MLGCTNKVSMNINETKSAHSRKPTGELNMKDTYKLCYVTGKENTQPFDFGTGILAGLTEEMVAHFILRAKKDPTHLNIMTRLQQLYAEGTEILDRNYTNPVLNAGDYVQIQLSAVKNDVESAQLLYEKAKRGVEILDGMRREYKENGKLSA